MKKTSVLLLSLLSMPVFAQQISRVADGIATEARSLQMSTRALEQLGDGGGRIINVNQDMRRIEQLIADGINVNVTLLFAVARYEEVVRAWARGLAAFLQERDGPFQPEPFGPKAKKT